MLNKFTSDSCDDILYVHNDYVYFRLSQIGDSFFVFDFTEGIHVCFQASFSTLELAEKYIFESIIKLKPQRKKNENK